VIRASLTYLFSLLCFFLLVLVQEGIAQSVDTECKYPDTLDSLFIPPDRRLGDYRLEMVAPNFNSRVSIQQHLKYSEIFASLVADRLSKTTNGRCSATASSTSYPDIYFSLIRSASSKSLEPDRSDCLLALLGSIKEIQPTDAEISAAALRVAEKTVYWLAPTLAVFEAFADVFDALAWIYVKDTVLSALSSVDPSDLLFVTSDDFNVWLNHQSAQRREALIPVPVCREGVESQSSWRAKRGIDVQSPVIPPGMIKVVARRKEIVGRRPLRRLVLFGLSHGRVAKEVFTPCKNRIVKAPPAENATAVSVPISCVRVAPAHADWWVAFYCDPANCVSEFQERIALEEIAASADVIKSVSTGSNDLPERGPYIVEVDIKSR
jgi:hypothetical protein